MTTGKLLFTIPLGALLACASIPRDPNYDGSFGGALGGGGGPIEPPGCTDICWVMSVRNDNYSEARVYINGLRAATLPGMMRRAVGIPIRRSMLDGAGCMDVIVKLYPDTKTARSSKACPVKGSRLDLSINESYGFQPLQLWLNDWRRR